MNTGPGELITNVGGALRCVCRIFNEFLMTNERHVAKEVRDEYVETMSKIYYSYFKSYSSRLMKLQVPAPGRLPRSHSHTYINTAYNHVVPSASSAIIFQCILGLFSCFRNPPNSDKNHRIFDVRT